MFIYLIVLWYQQGFPGGATGKESACQCRRHKRLLHKCIQSLSPEHPQSRKWQPILVFLPGSFHGQRSLVSYSLWDGKESDMIEQLRTHTHSRAKKWFYLINFYFKKVKKLVSYNYCKF